MKLDGIFHRVLEFFGLKEKKNKKINQEYLVKNTNIRFFNIPISIFLVIKKYGWVVFFYKSIDFIKKFSKECFKKIKKLYQQTVFSLKNDGLGKMMLRIMNYIFYGKGVLNKNEIKSRRGCFIDQSMFSDELVAENIVVIVHLYYTDMWPDIARKLKNIPCEYKLIISLTKNHFSKSIIKIIKKYKPDAKIIVFENKGMDVLPFLKCLKYAHKNTKYVLKIHTKKSIDTAGNAGYEWYQDLLNHVLPNKKNVDMILNNLEYSNIGMFGGSRIFDDTQNYEQKIELIYKYKREQKTKFKWVSGTMFWVKYNLISKLAEDSFISFVENNQPSNYAQANTIVHGIERYFGKLVYDAGKTISLAPERIYNKNYTNLFTENDIITSKKIIFVGHDADYAGAPLLNVSILKELKENFKVKVYLILKSGGILEKEYKKYATVYNLAESYQTYDQKINLIRNLKLQGVDNAITSSVVSADVADLLNNEGIKILSLIHEMSGSIKKYNWIDSAKTIAKKADFVVFPSNIVKDGFIEIVDRVNGKIVVRPQGLLRENIYKNDIKEARILLREQLGLKKDSLILLGVGNADLRKGIDLFLDVAARITNPQVYFLWVGNVVPDMEKIINQRIKNYKNVIFIKTTPEISIYYAGADLYLLTSREDPFPSVVLESMSVGVPVIGFQDAGGFVDIVNSETGMLVPFEDTNKMTLAINNFLKNELKRKMLGNASRKLIERSFVFKDYVYYLLEMLDMHRETEISDRKKFFNSSKSTYDLEDIDHSFKPMITIIVPNYNHEEFLRQRLDSIYFQTYKNFEVILLDDKSSDNSREILIEYAKKYNKNTRYIFNEKNSGSVFSQWKLGIEEAKGDFIWIAESDDYCTNNFISSLVPFLSDESIMIAYCRSVFEKNGKQIWDIESYLADIDQNKWKADFIETAHNIVNSAMAKKNIIPNVSSAIFRKPEKMCLLEDAKWRALRFCGDWVFYLNIMRGGAIAYTTKATNFYRQHERNTSTKLQTRDIYYQEHEYVAMKVAELYKVSSIIFNEQEAMLQTHWKTWRDDFNPKEFSACYDIEKIKAIQKNRKPNIAMFGSAFSAGGGEVFPIILANIFYENGYSVTFIDCNMFPRVEGVRKMLKQSIPVIKLPNSTVINLLDFNAINSSDFKKMILFINSLGIEILHSHYASIDFTINRAIKYMSGCRHIVTLHGMYEALDDIILETILPNLCTVDQWIYTAEKNIEVFKKYNIYNKNKFIKIGNALARSEINPISREDLNIKEDAFIFCLVSRSVPEKGWEESIQCIEQARLESGKDIHLIIIGDGDEKERLQPNAPNFVHFLGFKNNIRDYYAMSDMGIIPSRFKGESFPLIIIDCLFAGKPILASNIAEIRTMIKSENGQFAGALFDLINWEIPKDELTRLIIKCATDTNFYDKMLFEVRIAANKFDINNIFLKYAVCYKKIYNSSNK